MTRPGLLDVYRSTDAASPAAVLLTNTPSTASEGTIAIARSGEVLSREARSEYQADWRRDYVPVVALIGLANALTPTASTVGRTAGVVYVDAFAGSGGYPQLAVTPTSLAEALKPTIHTIAELLNRLARERGISSAGVSVSTFTDPEDGGDDEIVLTQRVDLPADRALSYWDDASAAIERWTRTVAPELAEQINRHIAVQIQWSA